MAPCYLWAQNHSHLLVKLKFTPKIDIPGNNLIIIITFKDIWML